MVSHGEVEGACSRVLRLWSGLDSMRLSFLRGAVWEKDKLRAHCESVRCEAGKGLYGGGGRGIGSVRPQDAAGTQVTAGLRAEMKTVNGWPQWAASPRRGDDVLRWAGEVSAEERGQAGFRDKQ